MQLDAQLAQMYALALVASARADGEISLEEGLRLQHLVDRAGSATSIDDLLMADRVRPEAFAALVQGDPFRGRSVHPLELAPQLVSDALEILLAKGHVAAAELAALRAFVGALGIGDEQLRALAGRQARWLPPF